MHIGGFGHMGTYIDLMYLYASSPLTPFSIEIRFMKKKVSFFIMILLCAAALLANKKLFAYSHWYVHVVVWPIEHALGMDDLRLCVAL